MFPFLRLPLLVIVVRAQRRDPRHATSNPGQPSINSCTFLLVQTVMEACSLLSAFAHAMPERPSDAQARFYRDARLLQWLSVVPRFLRSQQEKGTESNSRPSHSTRMPALDLDLSTDTESSVCSDDAGSIDKPKGARFPEALCRSLVNLGRIGGARRNRTDDLLHAMQALSQLSYGPILESGAGWDPRRRWRNLGPVLPAIKRKLAAAPQLPGYARCQSSSPFPPRTMPLTSSSSSSSSGRKGHRRRCRRPRRRHPHRPYRCRHRYPRQVPRRAWRPARRCRHPPPPRRASAPFPSAFRPVLHALPLRRYPARTHACIWDIRTGFLFRS